MPDITTRVAEIQSRTRELHRVLATIDEHLSGPKPQPGETGHTLASADGIGYELDEAINALSRLQGLADDILYTIHDDRPQENEPASVRRRSTLQESDVALA